MKLLMLLGGLIGFAIGLAAGLARDSAWPELFWRASVAALLAGVALRWWGGVWARSLRQALRERALRDTPTDARPALSPAKP